jgi:hypothetical protein
LDQSKTAVSRSEPIAKNQNTYAKRQREMEKKAKAEAKRARRVQQKESGETSDGPEFIEHPELELERAERESRTPDSTK